MDSTRFTGYEHLRESGSDTCNQWLVGFNEHGEYVICDGCHSAEAGVAEALALHLGIGFRSNDEVRTWARVVFTADGVEFYDIEPDDSNVNKDAMATSREMVQWYYKQVGRETQAGDDAAALAMGPGE